MTRSAEAAVRRDHRFPRWGWGAIILLHALLFFAYRYLSARTGNPNARVMPPLINEFTGVGFGWLLLFVVALPVMRRWPWDRSRVLLSLTRYLALLVVYSALHTTLLLASRTVLYPLFGMGYRYGPMPWPYLMEFPIDATAMILTVLVYHLLRSQREARERALHAAETERALSDARLRALQGNLQPHFLFNALNTIASQVHDDPQQADRMITHLSELLRATVRERNVDRVPLRRELELLDHYAALLRARFGDRLVLDQRIDPSAIDAMVPALLLQPLVENSVRHGNLSRTGRATIRVSVVRDDSALEVVVADDGPGADADPWGTDGIGLRGTAERLELMYGTRQTMRAANENGGFAVHIRVPHDRADEH